ncbi:hypothetical protein [Paraburkholderia sp. SIMBA_054]|uniref:hypothetical protein n=1 Tax=Paraburkholderia sp. SIMBA_054 TaxID=3085795 RepID=UPI00397E58EA
MSHHFNMADQIAGALVRGVAYNVERKIFHGMNLPTMLVVGAVIIAAVWFFTRPRPRGRRF